MDGHWLAPIRVDTEEPYAASWPRIGAAERGRADRRVGDAVRDRATASPCTSCSARELGPGGERFGQAIIVDRNIEEATGTSPDLAVSSTGQADVVYRVVEPSTHERRRCCVPGDVVEQVRVAHFDGAALVEPRRDQPRPGRLDAPADRRPTRPQIAIGPTGNGVVVWQEPEHRRRRADLGQAPVRHRRSTT